MKTSDISAGDRLQDMAGFGHNPGALRARTFVPTSLGPRAPLVVVLHGCTQTAAAYDRGTGWSQLAAREGFAMLFPEQTRANNGNLCFNWFVPADIARTGGEAESIAAMVAAMIAAHDIDPARVFVTGLSAGGAMTAVMLATYPELFAGGAIVGGIAYGSAGNVGQAMNVMRGGDAADDRTLAARVVTASDGHAGQWPRVSIWHGTADKTVAPTNMAALRRQWGALHRIGADAPIVEIVGRAERRSWADDTGRACVEEWAISEMGHGVPIDPAGPDRLGKAGSFMLDVGLASTAIIAQSWGIAAPRERARVEAESKPILPLPALNKLIPRAARRQNAPRAAGPPHQAAGLQKVIEDALRAAGLMR